MTEQKKTTIKDFVSIAMLSAALVFGLTHMPTAAESENTHTDLASALTNTVPATSCDLQLVANLTEH